MLHRLDGDRQSLRAAQVHGPGTKTTGFAEQMLDQVGAQRRRRTARSAAVEERHRRDNRPEQGPANDERGQQPAAPGFVFGGEVHRDMAVCVPDRHKPLGRVRERRLARLMHGLAPLAGGICHRANDRRVGAITNGRHCSCGALMAAATRHAAAGQPATKRYSGPNARKAVIPTK